MPIHRVAFAVAAALAVTAAHAEKSAAFYELSADGEVQIATDGRVSDYHIDSKLPDPVAALVSRKVHTWRFDPILVDGTAVAAKTAMHLGLRAEPAEGKTDEFVVRVISVNFGAPTRSTGGRQPRYPDAAIGSRLGAKVVLAARLDETGKVVEVVPYQTSLGARARNENEAEKWRRVFEKASVEAAKTWRYDLSETVAGHRIGSHVVIPVVFYSGPSPSADKWNGYVPGPIHPIPWNTQADEKRIAGLGDGETLSTGSRFHLQDDVIGKIL